MQLDNASQGPSIATTLLRGMAKSFGTTVMMAMILSALMLAFMVVAKVIGGSPVLAGKAILFFSPLVALVVWLLADSKSLKRYAKHAAFADMAIIVFIISSLWDALLFVLVIILLVHFIRACRVKPIRS